jgi:dethiobiotin synthetase
MESSKFMVTGTGPDVGKTIVSAILTTLLKGDYWKPVECGPIRDSHVMRNYLDEQKHHIFPPAYSLNAPISPHQASQLENICILPENISLPQTERPLIMETAGGILVPLNHSLLSLDHFASWPAQWIVVSKHYLGSINHTLMTIEILKARRIPILGIIFNGQNAVSEKVLLHYSGLPLLGHLQEEKNMNLHIIEKYAKRWQPHFKKNLIG